MQHLAIYVCVSHEHENGARYLVGRSDASPRQPPGDGLNANRPFCAKRPLQARRIDPTGRHRIDAYGSKIESKSARQQFHAAKRRRNEAMSLVKMLEVPPSPTDMKTWSMRARDARD